MSTSTPLTTIAAPTITPDSFAPFGQVIYPTADGRTYGPEDAQLDLSRGTPRFYIMGLDHKGRQFSHITRHRQCTQCLGALNGADWFMAVAPPGPEDHPDPARIRAFHIPGTCFIKLHVGTWHAGPYFDHPHVDFYNLELSDTNVVDHQTCDLQATFSLIFHIAP